MWKPLRRCSALRAAEADDEDGVVMRPSAPPRVRASMRLELRTGGPLESASESETGIPSEGYVRSATTVSVAPVEVCEFEGSGR